MATLLERVHELMKKKEGLNETKLSRELGISHSSFSDWKRGKGKPSLDAVIKFSQYFNVSIDYLVYGEEYKQETSSEISDAKDAVLLEKFHLLTPELQTNILYYIDGMIATMPKPLINDDEKRLSV